MLVLRRKVDDKITLVTNDNITIELLVVSTRRHDVQIGITAPASVRVIRNELLEHIDGDNTNESGTSGNTE